MESIRFSVLNRAFLLVTLVGLLSACGGGNDTPPPPPPPAKSSINLQIMSTEGDALSLVNATIAGKSVAKSDANGLIKLTDLDAETDISIKFEKSGFANQVHRFRSGAKDTFTQATITMSAYKTVTNFETATTAVDIIADSGAKVIVDGSDFVDSSGSPVTGTIDLSITPIDVSTPAGLEAFPGSFSARSETGEDVPVIVTYGTTEYKFTQADQQLQLASGKTAKNLGRSCQTWQTSNGACEARRLSSFLREAQKDRRDFRGNI